MNLFSFLARPQPWSWLIQDDPNPELSRLDLLDLRIDGVLLRGGDEEAGADRG